MQKYRKMVAFKGRTCRLKRRHKGGRDIETDARRQLRRQQRKASDQENQPSEKTQLPQIPKSPKS